MTPGRYQLDALSRRRQHARRAAARKPAASTAAISPIPKLVTAVNTAIAVGQPLLVTGEPGTGKTMLAWSIASELGLGSVLEFHTRSDNQARDALYDFDYLLRFYHAQTRDARAEQLESYIRWQALGEAIRSPTQRVVLIDEIDKAPRDFPNDLLDELDRMEFRVPELGHDLQGGASAGRRHHQQQRAPASGSVPAPLHFPSPRLSRPAIGCRRSCASGSATSISPIG